MINANELRIGNFVFDEDNDWCQISVLYSEKKINFEGWSEDYIPIEYHDKDDIYLTKVINPIPLNAKVLRKCGLLVKTGTPANSKQVYSDFGQYRIYLNVGGKFNSLHFNASQGWFPQLIKLKYLHELQNLYFALIQTELEIKF